MKQDDEGLRAVREVREKISAQYGHDPARLVQHYIEEQERYKERLLQPTVVREEDDSGKYHGGMDRGDAG